MWMFFDVWVLCRWPDGARVCGNRRDDTAEERREEVVL